MLKYLISLAIHPDKLTNTSISVMYSSLTSNNCFYYVFLNNKGLDDLTNLANIVLHTCDLGLN